MSIIDLVQILFRIIAWNVLFSILRVLGIRDASPKPYYYDFMVLVLHASSVWYGFLLFQLSLLGNSLCSVAVKLNCWIVNLSSYAYSRCQLCYWPLSLISLLILLKTYGDKIRLVVLILAGLVSTHQNTVCFQALCSFLISMGALDDLLFAVLT